MAEKTSNRFRKSIETASENTQDKSQGNTQAKKQVKRQSNIQEKPQETASKKKPKSVLESVLNGERNEAGQNCTLYLSAPVVRALWKHAEDANMSRSELADKILRRVLLDQ